MMIKRLATPLLAVLTTAALAFAGACGGTQESQPETPIEDSDPVDDPAADEGADDKIDDADAAADMPDAVAQAERGAEVYASDCGFCHGSEGEGAGGNPPVVGDDVLANYQDAGELLTYVREEMPEDDPGGLSDEEFQDVVAFMLEVNGVDLTGKSVTAEAAADITF